MTQSVVTAVRDAGNDVLEVEGVIEGKRVAAQGWVSATTNHYDPNDDHDDGTRRANAKPRALTPEETLEYARGLLQAAVPAKRDLGLRDPDADEALAEVEKAERAARTKRVAVVDAG